MILPVCMEPMFEGLLVQDEAAVRRALGLKQAGVKLLGTSADAIDRAEDRQRFGEVIEKLKLKAPPFGTARTVEAD